MTPKQPDAKKGEGVLSRKRWKMALTMQRNANVPSAEANEDAVALDAHDLALRTLLARSVEALRLTAPFVSRELAGHLCADLEATACDHTVCQTVCEAMIQDARDAARAVLAEHDKESTSGAQVAGVGGAAETGASASVGRQGVSGAQAPTAGSIPAAQSPLVEQSPPAPEATGKCMCGALTQDGDVHRQSAPCYVRSVANSRQCKPTTER